jgi:hypothetical protein
VVDRHALNSKFIDSLAEYSPFDNKRKKHSLKWHGSASVSLRVSKINVGRKMLHDN